MERRAVAEGDHDRRTAEVEEEGRENNVHCGRDDVQTNAAKHSGGEDQGVTNRGNLNRGKT